MKLSLGFVVTAISVLGLLGCAQNLWIKQNSTQGEFERDKYNCLQQSQQRVGIAQVNAYGGTATNTVQTNDMLFSSCMNSKGWSLQNKDLVEAQASQNQVRNNEIKQRFDQISSDILAMCGREELKDYYKKTACKAPDISFEQIADTTKITSLQKTSLIKQREHVASLEKAQDDVQRLRGEAGQKVISIAINFIRPENEKNNLDLYNGKITWGEYNKKRKEIFIESQNKFRQ